MTIPLYLTSFRLHNRVVLPVQNCAQYNAQALTLSCPGARLVHILSIAIHISPNIGPINMILSGKLVVGVLTMHCAL